MSTRATTPALDHLVVLADTLAEGADWCAATLGVAPEPGGDHPLFGTHNMLLAVSSEAFPQAYLEVLAIDPHARPAVDHPRWFDLDDPELRADVRACGPRLAHWVARVPDLALATSRLAALGVDRGEALAASRRTGAGLLEWHITLRADGRRLMSGCLPTLIRWGARHPADQLAPSPVRLRSLTLRHPDAATLTAALHAIGLVRDGADLTADGTLDLTVEAADHPELLVVLSTPSGDVRVSSRP